MNLQKRNKNQHKKLNILPLTLKVLLTVLSLVSFDILKAQDIHFSQYFNNPLSLNPSQTGSFEGDWRAYGNYRDQWRAIAFPFKTISCGYDRQITVNGQNFGVGGYVFNDQSGVALSCNQVYLSGAYHRNINNAIFSGGVQVGYVMKSINYDKIAFPDEWNGTDFVRDLNTSSGNDQLSYLDVNIGFGWRKKIDKYEPEAGISFFHLNMPTESFSGESSNKVPMRSAIFVAVKTEISPVLYVKPGILFYTMRGARDMMIGGQAGFTPAGNRFNVREVYGGIYLRNGLADPTDAVMLMAGAQIRKLAINISYDFNISKLRAYSNYRGGFELSFVFKSITSVIKTFTIPCERF
jgi:type IX secretion system PorP/SprF family membrane protein